MYTEGASARKKGQDYLRRRTQQCMRLVEEHNSKSIMHFVLLYCYNEGVVSMGKKDVIDMRRY